MIPEAFIREWSAVAPWKRDVMVEQDLIICRVLISIFSHPVLVEHLVFRGGTALHKLHLKPARRYSEDIDLVQIKAGPIGHIFDALRETLDPFLGKPKRKQGPGVVALTYRMQSEIAPVLPMRLKVEINSREHFAILPLNKVEFATQSRWFTGRCLIPCYDLEELLGTKLRALYQRRKGRDLFDLWLGLTVGKAKPDDIVRCFHRYMKASSGTVSMAEYRMNMEDKIGRRDFVEDVPPFLRPDVEFDVPTAYELIDRQIIGRLDHTEASIAHA